VDALINGIPALLQCQNANVGILDLQQLHYPLPQDVGLTLDKIANGRTALFLNAQI
jgi:hypothetical protein